MPIGFSELQGRKLGKLLVRSFTKKQLVILKTLGEIKSGTITSTVKRISDERKIPLSTVKLDLKIFEQLELIRIVEKFGFKKPVMTKFGKTVCKLLSNYVSLANRLVSLIRLNILTTNLHFSA